MGAKLRTWIGSWRVWMAVGCVVYIGLIHGQGSRIAAAWAGGVWVAVGLLFLALLIVSWIVSDVLVRYVLVPFVTRYQGKKTNDLTAKAQEKFADSMMSISTAIVSAVFISVLVFPLTVFIQTMATGKDPLWALWSWLPGLLSRGTKPEWWPLPFAVMFLGLYFLPLAVARWVREQALKIYDTLPPSAPAVAPTDQGTTEQSHIPPAGQTTHTSVNGGSRRRRRPRAQ